MTDRPTQQSPRPEIQAAQAEQNFLAAIARFKGATKGFDTQVEAVRELTRGEPEPEEDDGYDYWAELAADDRRHQRMDEEGR